MGIHTSAHIRLKRRTTGGEVSSSAPEITARVAKRAAPVDYSGILLDNDEMVELTKRIPKDGPKFINRLYALIIANQPLPKPDDIDLFDRTTWRQAENVARQEKSDGFDQNQQNFFQRVTRKFQEELRDNGIPNTSFNKVAYDLFEIPLGKRYILMVSDNHHQGRKYISISLHREGGFHDDALQFGGDRLWLDEKLLPNAYDRKLAQAIYLIGKYQPQLLQWLAEL